IRWLERQDLQPRAWSASVPRARRGVGARAPATAEDDRARAGRKMRIVSSEQARRIAVRSQLLDGSATNVLDTVRHLGFLQLDPVSTVAPPQRLVLWSRLGPYDPQQIHRLLLQGRKLFEWHARARRSSSFHPLQPERL